MALARVGTRETAIFSRPFSKYLLVELRSVPGTFPGWHFRGCCDAIMRTGAKGGCAKTSDRR